MQEFPSGVIQLHDIGRDAISYEMLGRRNKRRPLCILRMMLKQIATKY